MAQASSVSQAETLDSMEDEGGRASVPKHSLEPKESSLASDDDEKKTDSPVTSAVVTPEASPDDWLRSIAQDVKDMEHKIHESPATNNRARMLSIDRAMDVLTSDKAKATVGDRSGRTLVNSGIYDSDSDDESS